MDNERRKEFIQQFAADVNQIARKEFYKRIEDEATKPTIGEVVDGYKGFIYDLGGSFLEIAENYNQCIQIAKMNKLIGYGRLKARIKDFSSSSINSEKKELDDIFGIELVTATEFEKEVLMLFNHLAFNINRDKKFNKPSGYVAYHCMGDFSPEEGPLKEKIRQTIEQTKTKEYKYSKADPSYKNRKNLVPLFPNLREYISETKNMKELTRVLEEMLEYISLSDVSKENTPVIEFHFLTIEKEQEALTGVKANHANYKKTNTKLIEEYFKQGKLLRGINAPWKFVGGKQGLKLQDFYDTVIENWPFLKRLVIKKANSGVKLNEIETISKVDVLTASQFPFLRKYLKRDYEYQEEKNDEKWGLLKALIIANKISRYDTTHSIEDNLASKMGNISLQDNTKIH